MAKSYWLGPPNMPTSWRSLAEFGEDDRDGWTISLSVCKLLFSGSKIDSREAQNGPSEASKWSPDRPRTARSGQERARSPQERPKSLPRAPQERPRAPQERPRGAQEQPKRRPRDPKTRPRDPKRDQFGLQGVQNRVQIKKKSLPERIPLSIAFSIRIVNIFLHKLV